MPITDIGPLQHCKPPRRNKGFACLIIAVQRLGVEKHAIATARARFSHA